MKIVTADIAVAEVKSNTNVFIHSAAAAPQALIEALVSRSEQLRNVEIVHMHTEGKAPYTDPKLRDSFHHKAFFAGSNVRSAIASGEADYIPIFLSEIPQLFLRGIIPLDCALVQVSPPDKHGFCSLGTSVDASRAATKNARVVIAQINSHVPRTLGDGLIHVNEIDFGVECDQELPHAHHGAPNEIDLAIGKNVASLIEDGATLQLGIGAIPDAALASLHSHRDLGIHSEMFSDGIIDLVKKGVITGAKKRTHPGKIVGSFLIGSRRLYDFVDDNPQVLLLDVSYVNDTAVIRRNPKVTAINSAIEVDITGQVCADSIGTRHYSGVGGQMDFIRGASLSEGGKPIIALPSMTAKGHSKISSVLQPGAGVVTTRAHVHYIVTEYGIAALYGKTLRERAKALIAIAHPSHRERLEREAADRFKVL